MCIQLGLPRAFYDKEHTADMVDILRNMFVAMTGRRRGGRNGGSNGTTQSRYAGAPGRLEEQDKLSRVGFLRYFAQRPPGALTLPAVDRPELKALLRGMEKDETKRRWRRASIVIQCAVRGKLARKEGEHQQRISGSSGSAGGGGRGSKTRLVGKGSKNTTKSRTGSKSASSSRAARPSSTTGSRSNSSKMTKANKGANRRRASVKIQGLFRAKAAREVAAALAMVKGQDDNDGDEGGRGGRGKRGGGRREAGADGGDSQRGRAAVGAACGMGLKASNARKAVFDRLDAQGSGLIAVADFVDALSSDGLTWTLLGLPPDFVVSYKDDDEDSEDAAAGARDQREQMTSKVREMFGVRGAGSGGGGGGGAASAATVRFNFKQFDSYFAASATGKVTSPWTRGAPRPARRPVPAQTRRTGAEFGFEYDDGDDISDYGDSDDSDARDGDRAPDRSGGRRTAWEGNTSTSPRSNDDTRTRSTSSKLRLSAGRSTTKMRSPRKALAAAGSIAATLQQRRSPKSPAGGGGSGRRGKASWKGSPKMGGRP